MTERCVRGLGLMLAWLHADHKETPVALKRYNEHIERCKQCKQWREEKLLAEWEAK